MHIAIADQIKLAFQVQNRRAASVGAVFGALVPLAAFAFAHFGADVSDWRGVARWAFVALCLLFSAPKVYRWATAAFASSQWPRIEALAFALLLEGAMTLADHAVVAHAVVSYACLAVLVAVNALYCACSASLDQKTKREAARVEERNPDTLSLVPTVRPRPVKITAQKRKAVR
jgi:hypothetical protein